MTAKQVIERLTREGWYEDRQKGRHNQVKHADKAELITVPVHNNRGLTPGTLATIKRKAGW